MGYTGRELVADLRRLGVSRGGRLIVHSSLSSIGYVEGGAGTVIRALQQALHPDGLLVIPAFTFGRQKFDVRFSVPVIGAIPRQAVGAVGFYRSNQPTHSFALYGKDARSIAEGHQPDDAIGPTSALHHLYENEGHVLLLGVDHRSNTAIHLAEFLADVPYGEAGTALVVQDGGGVKDTVIPWRPGCSEAFNRVQPVIEGLPGYRKEKIGRAQSQLIPLRSMINALVDRLRKEPGWLLGSCPWCQAAKPKVRAVTNER